MAALSLCKDHSPRPITEPPPRGGGGFHWGKSPLQNPDIFQVAKHWSRRLCGQLIVFSVLARRAV